MYYTKREILDKLHIADSTLYQMVRDGRLHPIMPPNRIRGAVYDSDEVDALAMTLTISPDARVVNFETIAEQDLPHIVARLLDGLHTKVEINSMDVFRLRQLRYWWSINPYMFIGLKKNDGFFAGQLGLVHANPDNIQSYLDDEYYEPDMPVLSYVDKFVQIDGGPKSDYYITAMFVDSGIGDTTYYAAMARGLKLLIAKLGRMGVDINSIAHRSKLWIDWEIENERHFFHSLGFQEEEGANHGRIYRLSMKEQVQPSSAAAVYLAERQNSWQLGRPRNQSFDVEEQYILFPNGVVKTYLEVFGRQGGSGTSSTQPHIGPKRGRPPKQTSS